MMIMLFGRKNNQTGAASMIVVIFMSIILTIVTIGFIRIAINEQRDSTDEDLTARAYYAAESGIEDARRAIKENIKNTLTDADLNATNCDAPNSVNYDPVLSSPAEFDIEYSCMLIDFTPDIVKSELGSSNLTRQYEINPVNPSGGSNTIGNVILSWHIDADPADDGDGLVSGAGPVTLRSTAASDIPAVSSWPHPALMRVTFVTYPDPSHPSVTSFDRSDILSSTMVISPNSNGSGTTGAAVFPGGAVNPAVDGRVYAANCADNDNNMVCRMEFDMSGLPANRALEIRLTNVYVPTTFELALETSGGTPLLFDGAQVVADVTGRAGAVYRRVEAAIDVSTNALIPDFAVQSVTDICKDFSFTNNLPEFGGQAGTSCTVL